MSKIIGILDSDTQYSNKLMEYLKRRIRTLAQIRVFSDLDNLHRYLEHNILDVLLLEENLYPLKERDFSNIHIVVLTENNIPTTGQLYPNISKYQSAENLIEELKMECPELKEWTKQKTSEDTLEIIATYSLSCGGIGEILAYEYGGMGKCLFINLAPFTGLVEEGTVDGHKGMSDLIYYMNEKVENIKEKIELTVRIKENIEVISDTSFATDLCDLTIEGIRTLITSIRDCKKYNFLIFHAGFVSPAILELFQICSRLYAVIGTQAADVRRKENFLKQLKWAGVKDRIEKLEVIKMSDEEIELLSKRYEEGVEDERVVNYIRKYITYNI